MRAEHRLDLEPLRTGSRPESPGPVRIFRATIFPENIAADASAISWESPGGVDLHPEPLSLLVQLVDRGETDRDEHGVDLEGRARCPRSDGTCSSTRATIDPLDPVRSLGPQHRVGRVDRDAEPEDLVPMHLVSADIRAGPRRGRRRRCRPGAPGRRRSARRSLRRR